MNRGGVIFSGWQNHLVFVLANFGFSPRIPGILPFRKKACQLHYHFRLLALTD
jgi:hypothetical protein